MSSKAYSFIHVSAILEDLFRQLDIALTQDIRKTGVQLSALPISVLGAVDHELWRDLQETSVNRHQKRVALLNRATSHAQDTIMIPAGLPSLGITDGHTIGEDHFRCIWTILSLPGDPFPTLQHKASIIELREMRNDIAHWRRDPNEIGARRQYSDLIRMVDRTTDTVEHAYLSILEFLDNL